MQIQRIQSVYLFLTAVLMAVFTFLPVIGLINDNGQESIGAIAMNSITYGSWLLLCLDVLIIVLAMITLFKYRNLKLQLKLCKILLLLIITLLVCVGIITYMQKGGAIAAVQWGIALPIVSMVCVMLAHKGIKHDRKLLSDSERIR